MINYDTFIHLCAGGLGGTAGAIITCPLEVVKTRLQSSVATFGKNQHGATRAHGIPLTLSSAAAHPSVLATEVRPTVFGIWNCLKYIVETEGTNALFKGLGPNLVGVAPSRAIYFCTYSQAKKLFNSSISPETPLVHIFAAASAGLVSSTLTNPIWMVKTRLQLDQRKYGAVNVKQVTRGIYQEGGFRGFYKGITASYFGVSETIIHFVIYENIKAHLHSFHLKNHTDPDDDLVSTRNFIEYMGAGATSKTIASCLTYPHEVARTRLRQSGTKYRSFFQTLMVVFQEEGYRGLYRGLATQLVRQIPNTAIMMATYEAVVYLFTVKYPHHPHHLD